jgi:leucyl/phenylalanyl-tRNA--protein transferase
MDGKDNFPVIEEALSEPNGLLAFGGDLSIERLVKAYSHGIFPWYSDQEPILWWAPDPRMVLYPGNFHISKSLNRFLKKTPYQVHFNRNFESVIDICSETRKDGLGTWITDEMKQAYIELHKQGKAHCLEIDIAGKLAGGIYGVALDTVFYGESMFSRQANGSKIALLELCKYMLKNDYQILDCQVHSNHIESLGAELIPMRVFKKFLPKK